MGKLALDRLVHFLVVLSAWSGIALILYININGKPPETYPLTIANIFSYFTVLSNLFVGLISTYLLFHPSKLTGFLKLFEFGTLVNITITGIVYHIILASVWDPKGLVFVADQLLHTATPILYVINWVFFRPKSNMTYKMAISWFLFPIVYLIYTLVRGPMVDWYPYPFIDVSVLGINQVLVNSAFMTVFFLVVTFVYVLVNNRLKKN